MNSAAQDTPATFAEIVPVYVRHILLVGSSLHPFASFLRARGMETVEDGPVQGAVTLFDAVVLDASHTGPDAFDRAKAKLARHGLLYCIVPNSADAAFDLESRLRQADLKTSAVTLCTLGEVTVQAVSALRSDYSLQDHARLLLAEGRPDLAFCVLREVPLQKLSSDEETASLAVETQLSLLDLDRRTGGVGRVSHFFISQMAFYQAVARVPQHAVAYQCQAEFWRRLGSPSMGRRLLRSIQATAPTAAIQKQLDAYQGRPDAPEPTIPEAPEWEGGYAPRVLFITHPRIDYGLDTLCDGLRSALGVDRVIEYPWKPSLHGDVPPRLANYPCCFNHPGSPLSLDAILAQLRGGEFDLLLFGDTELNMPQEEARRIVEAAGEVPWAVVDQGDDPIDRRPEILAYLGRADPPVCFKREMLCCHDYGDGVFPLPFSYPDGRIPSDLPETRSEDLFWAGHRQFGLRRLYLDRLETALGRRLDRTYSQDEYARALQASRIGLSLFGGGFDTVRYWELPAHGCMLIAERPPIRIPYDFEDGVSAVFFTDLPELVERVERSLSQPEDVCRIADAGRERLRRYHTASARAAQLLARMSTTVVRQS